MAKPTTSYSLRNTLAPQNQNQSLIANAILQAASTPATQEGAFKIINERPWLLCLGARGNTKSPLIATLFTNLAQNRKLIEPLTNTINEHPDLLWLKYPSDVNHTIAHLLSYQGYLDMCEKAVDADPSILLERNNEKQTVADLSMGDSQQVVDKYTFKGRISNALGEDHIDTGALELLIDEAFEGTDSSEITQN